MVPPLSAPGHLHVIFQDPFQRHALIPTTLIILRASHSVPLVEKSRLF